MLVPPDGEAHEEVPDGPDDEDDDVERDDHPLILGGEDKLLDHVHVILVADAVIIVADRLVLGAYGRGGGGGGGGVGREERKYLVSF